MRSAYNRIVRIKLLKASLDCAWDSAVDFPLIPLIKSNYTFKCLNCLPRASFPSQAEY